MAADTGMVVSDMGLLVERPSNWNASGWSLPDDRMADNPVWMNAGTMMLKLAAALEDQYADGKNVTKCLTLNTTSEVAMLPMIRDERKLDVQGPLLDEAVEVEIFGAIVHERHTWDHGRVECTFEIHVLHTGPASVWYSENFRLKVQELIRNQDQPIGDPVWMNQNAQQYNVAAFQSYPIYR